MPSEHAFGRRFYNKNTSWRLVLCLSKFLCRAYLKISDGKCIPFQFVSYGSLFILCFAQLPLF
ncbi:hypothetical protein NEIPOLOT_02313 [Neisseria polysaccharea ATCC 43768]|nr:hypothetical protein NEIPOLOT_02313 [Neisseria polysaccharea ATCC 43768]